VKAKVKLLPQQAKLTLVTKLDVEPNIIKTLQEARYQIMARIATRVILQGKN
jgi:hypothetical protein